MRKMKDSGIDWIGEIPEEWYLRKGKYIFAQRNEKGNDVEIQLLSPTQKFGVIPQSLYEKLTGMKPVKLDESTDYSQMKSIYIGDFCISLRSFQGGFEYSNYNGVVSPAYQIFYSIENICNDYYRYMFKERGFIDKMSSYTKTFRDGKSISFTDFANSLIPVPSLPEQTTIAAYLDRQCTHIDNIIEKTKTSIEEYKKLKQAVITQAVTKGIRGKREMKDSGIDWIGEIPVEWEIVRLKSLFDFGKGLPITKENLTEFGVPVISYGQIHAKINTGVSVDDRLIRYVPKTYLTSNPASLVNEGDLIVADTSEDLDGCGNLIHIDRSSDIFAGYHTIILRTRKKQNNKYLAYTTLTDGWRSQLRCKVSGVKVFSISKKTLGECYFLYPSLPEQTEIADYLDQKCTEIDAIITKKQQFITEMENYKKSLIFECVTGKREVSV